MAKWVVGFHSVEESLKSSVTQANLYIATDSPKAQNLLRLATKKGIPVRSVTKQKIASLCGIKEAKDFALQILEEKKIETTQKDKSQNIEEFLENLEAKNKTKSTLLILDCITDPHNLGAILRSADMFNVDAVIIPQRGSAKESATVVKTSAGASRYVKLFVVPNLKRTIDLLKEYNFWIYGTDMNGQPLKEAKLSPRRALVMGSEGSGMRALTKNSCDSILTIETNGHIDSLNVSVACGVILYHFFANEK